MSNREEFEKLFSEYESRHLMGASGLVRKIGSHFYDARQPEIDALNEKLESREAQMETVGIIERELRNELARLQAENEKLRNASSQVLEQFDIFNLDLPAGVTWALDALDTAIRNEAGERL